ncbi:MAG: hypothetical protein ACJ788_19780, partial [Ktedonobacteraceae bacterium]
MRELADRRKAIADEEREQERIERELELRRAKAKRDTEERSDGVGSKRGPKPKKRKERNEALEEKLAHISDGVEVKVEGKAPTVRSFQTIVRGRRCYLFLVIATHNSLLCFGSQLWSCAIALLADVISHLLTSIADEPEKPKFIRVAKTPGPMDSPSPSKKAKLSPGTSSLSDIAQSPDAAPEMENQNTPAKPDVEVDSSDDDRVV